VSHCHSQVAAEPATPPWTASPALKRTDVSADQIECGKAVRHGLRNLRLHGGVRVEVDSQVAYRRGGRYEITANPNRVHEKLMITSARRTPEDLRLGCVEL